LTSNRVRRLGVSLLAGATAVGGASVLWTGAAGAATPTKIGFTPVATPTQILPNTAGQAVANEAFTLPNTFKNGEKVTIDIAPATAPAPTCGATGDWVAFTGTPTATVTGGSAAETKPSITVTPATNLGSVSSCTGREDQLTLVVGNTAAAGSTPWTVTVKGIKYTTMPKTPAGKVAVTAGASAAPATTTVTFTVTPPPTPNATVVYPTAARSTSPVPLNPSTNGQAVSDLTVTEPLAGTFEKTAVVTVALSGATFDRSAGSKATASGGGAAVTGTAVTFSSTGTSASFKVKTASSTGPATYTFSNLAVDTSTALGKVVATLSATNPTTVGSRSMPISGNVLPLGAVIQTSRVEGATADATAAAEFKKAYAVTATSTTTGNRSAVLATDADYQDALSAAYLAQGHKTAVLLTPKTTLSTVTLTTLAYEGVQHVYIVGGPLAVSNSIETQLKKTPSFKPGGATKRGSTTLTVTRTYGTTADQTAEKVAAAFRATSIGSFSAPNAYGGAYNDTTGSNGTTKHAVPTTPLRTAILARDGGYQDATAASALAYHTALPIVLTPTTTLSSAALAAIEDEGVQQVIVMGGPLAVTDHVVSELEASTVRVFRVAGQDATDTARELASFELAPTANAGRQWTATTGVYLARGNGYTDAVAGSALAAKTESPIVLTVNTTTIGQYDTGFFQKVGAGSFSKMAPTADFKVVVLGGGFAVTANAVNEVKAAITTGATS
jgi:putative cell wall-binding protein